MVHTFKFSDRYFAYDGMNATLIEVDELTAKVLDSYERIDREKSLDELKKQYGSGVIQEVLDEIDALKDEGVIFSSIDYDSIQSINDGAIKALCLHVSHDCNLRCKYCFAGTGTFGGGRSIMSADVGKKALDFLIANSGKRRHLEVDFFGGEPLMNFTVVKEIVAYGRELERQHDKSFNFTLTTNGYDLDDEIIDYLNQEMYNVVISLDGRGAVHDYMRPVTGGEGSQSKILKNAKLLVERRGNKSHYIRGTFTAHNLDFSEDVRYLAEQGFKQISIEPVVADEKLNYALNDDHLPAIKKEYDKLAKWYLDSRREGRWLNFFHFNIDLDHGPCVAKRLLGCGAGCEYVAVTPEGDIYPCHQFVGLDDFKLGSVDDGVLRDDLLKIFRANTVANKDKCKTCWAQLWCGGGCQANAWTFNKALDEPHEIECEMQKKRLECALAIYAIENQGH